MVHHNTATNEEVDFVLRRMHDATEAARTASEAEDRLRETIENEGGEEEEEEAACERE